MNLFNSMASKFSVKSLKYFGHAAFVAALMLTPFMAVNASSFPAGTAINHKHTITNNSSCSSTITGITKTWNSTGGVIKKAKNNRGGVTVESSTQQSGSFYYSVNNYVLAPGASIYTYIDFETKPDLGGNINSSVTWHYTSSCGQPCSVSGQVNSTMTPSGPNCTQSSFNASSASGGDTVTFSWNITNPGGQVKLVCGGADFSLNVNVPDSGSRNITVPSTALDGALLTCNLNVGATSLCGDNLDIDGVPSIQIDKTDQNAADQDGTQQNDTQTINEGDSAIFKIKVTNNGTEPLKNVVISDPESTSCNRTAAQTQSLYAGSTFAPGASFSYNCTKNNVTSTTFADGDNDISVTGQGNTSNQTVNDEDPTLVVVLNVDPGAIQILKWANNPNDKDGTPTGGNNANDTQSIDSGSNAIFRIQVKNTGPVALQDVLVNDNRAPQCALSANEVREILTTGSSSKSTISSVNKLNGTNNNNTLEPNEGFAYNCTQPNRVDGYTNIAATQGDPVNGQPRVSDNDPTEVLICDLTNCPPVGTPEIKIIKTDVNTNDQDNVQRNDTQTINVGEEAVFEITVTNTGREALENVVITDAEAPNCARTAAQTRTLYPGDEFDRGETFTYTCSRGNVTENTFLDGDNDAAVSGRGVDSGTTVNDDDPSLVVVVPAPFCGDGYVNAGEQCDDGNTVDGDGCSSTCTIEPVPTCTGADFDPDAVLAGDTSVFSWNTINITGNVNLKCEGSAGFILDELVSASDSRNITVPVGAALGTDTNCEISFGGTKLCEDTLHTRNSICGDGLQETGEMCDDGNTVDGDGCSSTCQLEPACVGTPFFDPNPVGANATSVFSWDTANTGTDVTLNCSGPAIVNFSETVPANGTRSVDTKIDAANGANATCTLEENGVAIPTCEATLAVDTSLPYCTDGIVNQPTEQCDDGNQIDDDACSNTCQINIPPHDIQVLKWARNDDDKDNVTTGGNAVNDTQTVESVDDNGLDKAVFRIRVENVGTEPLKNVRVQDANSAVCRLNANQVREILNTGTSTKTGISGVAVQNEVTKDDILQPGEAFVYNCTHPDVRDGFTNTAKALGDALDDSETVNDTDDTEVVVCNGPTCPPTGAPSIEIIKQDDNPNDYDNVVDSQLIAEGSTAVFSITVTNNGGESLTSVIVSDDEAPNCAKTAAETQALYPGNTFDVGETFTYTCDKPNANSGDFDGVNGQGSVDGHNDARVDAESVVDNDPVNDEDPSEVLFIAQCTPTQGEINIVKDDSTPGQPDTDGDDYQKIPNGGTANFTIIVSNPGTSVISNVSVVDALTPSCAKTPAEFMTLLGAEGNNDDKLDPGEVVTYTCSQTNVTADYTNSATASGLVETVPCVVEETDTSEVEVTTGGGGGFCGDGVVDPGESCDNGPSNGMNGNSCRADCTLRACVGASCGPSVTSVVGTCAFNQSTGAALCQGKKPVEDVSDEYWQKYRKCRAGEPGGYDITGVVASTQERACALRWAEDKGLALCGANIGGFINPFQPPTNAEMLAQCDPTRPPEPPCTPVNTPCPECFKAGNSIVKEVRPGDLSGPLATTTTVAKGENAKYQVTLNISDFDYSTHQILDAKVRVYDQTIPTESGHIFNRKGILDGDDNATWKWCDENALCPEFGEYFYQVLDGATIAEINSTGGTTLEVHYDMDTDVASTKDTANIKNVAYAMIYYTYSTTDGFGNVVTGNTVAGFGDNICQPAPPTKISQLAQGTFGSVANVNIIRPFVQAKAGNAGYFSTSDDKAFGDQTGIQDDTGLLTPTVFNQGVTITGNTNLDVYEGEQVGDAQDLAQFQQDKDDFYNNVDDATGTTAQSVPGTSLSFKQVGGANVFQVDGDLNVADLEGLSASATFIVTGGDVIIADADNKIEFTSGVFPAFIIRDGDLLIDEAVTDMQGMYLVEQGEIKSAADAVSTTQLKVSGNLYGDLGHLLAYRRYIGSGATIEPSIEINFDVRLLENTPPMLQQFLGEGWREAVQE